MFKKLFLLLSLIFTLLTQPQSIYAKNEVNLYLFWGNGCPHCAKEKVFLQTLEKKYPNLEIYQYEVWYSDENRKLLQSVGEKLNVEVSGVPFTVVGTKYFTGYYDDDISGKEIEDNVKICTQSICLDPVGELLGLVKPGNATLQQINLNQPPDKNASASAIPANINGNAQDINITDPKLTEKNQDKSIPSQISVPILGTVTIKNLSLPVLTLLLAGLDGFNPCAMWTLIFLISLLIGMQDRKKMWLLGGSFIIASAFVYFLFMAAWLNLILFIGFMVWVRLLIGLVAIFGGGYNLREFITNPTGACKVTGGEKRQKVFENIKQIVHEKSFLISLLGIILLAGAVNMVELVCSAGLPVVYTQVLTLSNLPAWQYYLYLIFYVLIFMLDDIFVFAVAVKTFELTGITTKYTRFSHLIGGVLMISIGLLIIFKPEILMFG